jgi:hypothetical protein
METVVRNVDRGFHIFERVKEREMIQVQHNFSGSKVGPVIRSVRR